jgi:hypothetical protein
MPRRIAQLIAQSQGVAPAQGDVFTPEIFVASVFDQTGLASLFSTITAPATPTGAGYLGGALVTNTTYKYRVSALGPLGETLGSTELSQATGASNAGILLTLTQRANAVAYRIYRSETAGAANTEGLVAVITAPPQMLAGQTFTVRDYGFPSTGVMIPTIDTTTLPTATGAPGTAITGATGATTAGSSLPLLSAYQYKYTAVNALGESTASAASATFTLTGTQNNFTGITLTAVTGAQYYNVYRAPVVATVVGAFTYLFTANANNSTNLQVLTTFVDDGNYKGSTKQPPGTDGTGGALNQPTGKLLVSPYFTVVGTTGGCSWSPNLINGQQFVGMSYGVVVDPSLATSTVGNDQCLIAQVGVVNAQVNTAANFTTALTSGTLATNAPGPLTNTVVPGTPLMVDGAGYLCPVGVFGVGTAASTQLALTTLPGQIVGYSLGTVGANQIQTIPVLLGESV